MEPLIGFIAFFAMIFGIVYLFFTTRNRERMALIEKGADASLFNTGKTHVPWFNRGKFALKTGMLLIGVGFGIIAGALLDMAEVIPNDASGYFSMIFIFGGLALVIFYLIDRRIK